MVRTQLRLLDRERPLVALERLRRRIDQRVDRMVAAGLDSARVGETEITGQVKDLCYGLYGKTAVPINREVQKKALKDYERGEEPITCRPAEVLEPELEKAKEEIGDLAGFRRGGYDLRRVSGGMLAGASAPVLNALRRYGDGLGLAFQIVDDLLDELDADGGRSARAALTAQDRPWTLLVLSRDPDMPPGFDRLVRLGDGPPFADHAMHVEAHAG